MMTLRSWLSGWDEMGAPSGAPISAFGGMVELADTHDSRSCGESRAGSSPAAPTGTWRKGKRRGLKHPGRKACGFDSRRPYEWVDYKP